MKELIRKWLDIPTRDEINSRIDRKVSSRVAKHYNKLRKADRDRYRRYVEANNQEDTFKSL